ncbi:hypothetical protein B0H13DRAFT_1893063 [Mycena leptocephala]|nr:hypothetical protein B0H13DRAFT_1893063 [Mycena leptocephala]
MANCRRTRTRMRTRTGDSEDNARTNDELESGKDERKEGRKGYVCTVAVTILFLATGIHAWLGEGELELDPHAQNIISLGTEGVTEYEYGCLASARGQTVDKQEMEMQEEDAQKIYIYIHVLVLVGVFGSRGIIRMGWELDEMGGKVQYICCVQIQKRDIFCWPVGWEHDLGTQRRLGLATKNLERDKEGNAPKKREIRQKNTTKERTATDPLWSRVVRWMELEEEGSRINSNIFNNSPHESTPLRAHMGWCSSTEVEIEIELHRTQPCNVDFNYTRQSDPDFNSDVAIRGPGHRPTRDYIIQYHYVEIRQDAECEWSLDAHNASSGDLI